MNDDFTGKPWSTDDYREHGRKLIAEQHPELFEEREADDGIAPDTIIEVQARQLLKARQQAEGWIATHRRDQAKIAEQQAEIDALKDALHTYINWTDILVAERDARIAALEAAGQRLLYAHEEYLRLTHPRNSAKAISQRLAEYHRVFIDEVK